VDYPKHSTNSPEQRPSDPSQGRPNSRNKNAPGDLAGGVLVFLSKGALRSLCHSISLNIVIEVELVGMRAHPHRIGLHFFLVVDPEIDEFGGEYAALEEELVILLELAERLFE
jgi:hypothetical protein